jgi:hypothetical protein
MEGRRMSTTTIVILIGAGVAFLFITYMAWFNKR